MCISRNSKSWIYLEDCYIANDCTLLPHSAVNCIHYLPGPFKPLTYNFHFWVRQTSIIFYFTLILWYFFLFAYTEHWSLSAKDFLLIAIQYFWFVMIGCYGAKKHIYVALKKCTHRYNDPDLIPVGTLCSCNLFNKY